MFNLPSFNEENALYLGSGSSANSWTPYKVPRWASYLCIQLVAGGGGGAGGASGASGTTRGGGGGGGSGFIITTIQPTFIMPSVIHFAIGKGSKGGLAGAAPTSSGGNTSLVFMGPTRNTVLSAQVFAIAGAGTSAAAGAANSNAGTASALAPTFFGPIFTQLVPNSGSNGGAITGGNGVAISTDGRLVGGTGGAGVGTSDVAFAGGTFTLARDGIARGSTGTGTDGQDGAYQMRPQQFIGATGGCSNGTGQGGKGGNGAPGCGGGGGGAGVTGGAGGDGGDGFAWVMPLRAIPNV